MTPHLRQAVMRFERYQAQFAFLRENDCAMYYKYYKGLLLDERREEILEQMDAVENVVERGLVED